MGNLDDTLKKHAARHGILRQVEAVGVVEEATKEIAKYVPQEEFEVISFKDGVLKVVTNSSIASSSIRLSLPQDFLEEKSIKRVIFNER